jgi:hypothetical protein
MARVGFFIGGFNGDSRDYFPFPIPNIGTITPIGVFNGYSLSLEDAFAFVWKYRVLRFTWDITLTDNTLPATYTYAGSLLTVIDPHVPLNELDIGNCPYLRHFGTVPADGAGRTATCDMQLNDYLGAGLKPFRMFTDIQVNLGFGANTVSTNYADPSLGGAVVMRGTILGNDVPIYGRATDSASGTFLVEPNEWWAYNDGTGPIWDSTNGNQLIFPIPANY